MRQWRLIIDTPLIGAANMAVDAAILDAVSQEKVAPTLRLYAWEPFCLSLGYGQRYREVDEDGLARNDWHVVRRPTGGQAILHGDELTYSVTLPMGHPLTEGDITESYRKISTALLRALTYLGLSPRADRQENLPKGTKGPVCFEVPSHYEVTVNGKKLLGSAQMRRKSGLLQHGTLPLVGDIARICDALVYEDESEREFAKEQVRMRALTLYDVLGEVITWEQAAEAITQGFIEQFELEFSLEDLSQEEIKDAERLINEVYGTEKWTQKRK